MNEKEIQRLAHKFLDGVISVDDFINHVAGAKVTEWAGIADVGHTRVDIDRAARCGFPEVIFAEGKTAEALCRIIKAMLDHAE